MKLSPLDIKRQQFGKAFRGYEPEEVDAFVAQIASQWESVLDELRLSTDRNRELEQKLKHYERVELALQEALETARETARRSEEAAERKAKIIIEQAELKADRTLQDVEQERFGLRRDIAKLTGRQNEVAARLRAFLMSELEILAQFQGDDPVGFIRLESGTPRAESAPEQLVSHEHSALSSGDAEDLNADRSDPQEHEPTHTTTPSEAAPSVDEALEQPEPVVEAAPASAAPPQASASAPGTPEPPTDPPVAEMEDTTNSEPPIELATPAPQPEAIEWDLPETVEPELQSGSGSDWNLRTLVTGESNSVAGSEAERERIRRILEDLD